VCTAGLEAVDNPFGHRRNPILLLSPPSAPLRFFVYPRISLSYAQASDGNSSSRPTPRLLPDAQASMTWLIGPV